MRFTSGLRCAHVRAMRACWYSVGTRFCCVRRRKFATSAQTPPPTRHAHHSVRRDGLTDRSAVAGPRMHNVDGRRPSIRRVACGLKLERATPPSRQGHLARTHKSYPHPSQTGAHPPGMRTVGSTPGSGGAASTRRAKPLSLSSGTSTPGLRSCRSSGRAIGAPEETTASRRGVEAMGREVLCSL
jgi:hypothetical protein